MKVLYSPHNDKHFVPSRGSKGAAGWDLYAAEDMVLYPFQPALVPTNIDIAIPQGHMLLVIPRSGNALKKNLLIPNSPGLVDEDYRGHLGVILTYVPSPREYSPESYYTVRRGDRIAQAVLVKYETQEWEKSDELSITERGSGGFGSTGA